MPFQEKVFNPLIIIMKKNKIQGSIKGSKRMKFYEAAKFLRIHHVFIIKSKIVWSLDSTFFSFSFFFAAILFPDSNNFSVTAIFFLEAEFIFLYDRNFFLAAVLIIDGNGFSDPKYLGIRHFVKIDYVMCSQKLCGTKKLHSLQPFNHNNNNK